MGSGYGRELKRILSAHGCYLLRRSKGDHEIWYSPITERNVTLDTGTRNRLLAKAVLKQAGIDEKI